MAETIGTPEREGYTRAIEFRADSNAVFYRDGEAYREARYHVVVPEPGYASDQLSITFADRPFPAAFGVDDRWFRLRIGMEPEEQIYRRVPAGAP